MSYLKKHQKSSTTREVVVYGHPANLKRNNTPRRMPHATYFNISGLPVHQGSKKPETRKGFFRAERGNSLVPAAGAQIFKIGRCTTKIVSRGGR